MARPKRGLPGRRVGWNKLKPATRKRYLGAGITRAHWEAGGDLRKARGHAAGPPPRAFPGPVGKDATYDDLQRARAWLASGRAPWWTRGLTPDVAAALSQIPWPPKKWGDRLLTPAADGGDWTLRVVPKGRTSNGIVTDRNGNDHRTTAYDKVIRIPGGMDGARAVMDLLRFGPPGRGGDPRPVVGPRGGGAQYGPAYDGGAEGSGGSGGGGFGDIFGGGGASPDGTPEGERNAEDDWQEVIDELELWGWDEEWPDDMDFDTTGS